MYRKVVKNSSAFFVSNDELFWNGFEDSSWEPHTFLIINKFISKNSVVLDVGAFNGVISLYTASIGATCYAFETDPIAIQKIQKNIEINPDLKQKIILIPKALTADGKPIKIYSRWNYGDTGTSTLKCVKSKNEVTLVESINIDQFDNQYNPSKIDFMKIDIEGGEFFLMESIKDFLETKVDTLYLSLHFEKLVEYYEHFYLRKGFLRRIYRLMDKDKKILKLKAREKLIATTKLLSSYEFMYDNNFQLLNIDNLSHKEIELLDSIIVSNKKL